MHDLDLKAMGCQSFSCFCSSVAPIPNLNESPVNFVGNFGWKNYREMFSLIIDLSLSNRFLWVKVKSQMDFFLTSSLKWWVCSDTCGINLHAIMPRKRCKSCSDFGKGMSLIALTFSGSEEISFLIFCVPRILVWSLQNHTCPYLFSNLTFKFYLKLAQGECLIDLGSILIWYLLGYSLPHHNPLLFPWCPVRKIHLHSVFHNVNAKIEVCRRLSKM